MAGTAQMESRDIQPSYTVLVDDDDPAADRDKPEKQSRKQGFQLLTLVVLVSMFIIPSVSFLSQPVYSETCVGDHHHHAIHERSLKAHAEGHHGHSHEDGGHDHSHKEEGASQEQEHAHEHEDGKGHVHEHAPDLEDDHLCHLRAQNLETLICGAILLVFIKACSLEKRSHLLPQMAGSTDSAKRDMPYGLAFRLMAMWRFWGMLVALISTVWKYRAHFSNSEFFPVRTDDGYFLVLDRGEDSLLDAGDLSEKCVAFESYSDIRSFGFLAFGLCETLAFLAGALFFGLGELFKIDIAKGYLVQRFLSLEFVGFYTTALVGDKLIDGFDNLIGKFKNSTKKYAGDIDKIQHELTHMQDMSLESLKGPASLFEGYAKKAVLGRLKPLVEPKLEKVGLSWDDVLPILEELDTPEEIQQATADPMKFIQEKAANNEGIARKLATAQLRPKIEPKLKEYDLEWAEFMLVLEEVDSIDEIQNAASDIPKFLESLAEKCAPVARRFALKALKPNLEPKLKEQDVAWDDVAEDIKIVLEKLDTLDEIKAVAADTPSFFKELAEPIARKVALKALKPKLEPKLKTMNLGWDDALLFLNEIDTVAEIQQAIADPEKFVDSLKSSAGIVARKAAMAQLQKLMEPTLAKQSLEWADVKAVLEEIDTVEELQAAIGDVEGFLKSLKDKSKAIALKWTLAQIRAKVEPKLKEGGVTWDDAVALLQKVDTVEELQKAAEDPLTFLQQFVPEQKEKAVSKEAAETEGCVNSKEKQKMVWPAVLQASAAALWISVNYINIDPCVSYESSVATSILFGFYDLEEGVNFVTFLAFTHLAMICTISFFLFIQGFAGKMGWVRTEKLCIVFLVLALMAYTVVLSTYQSPKAKEAGELETTTTGAPGKAEGAVEAAKSKVSGSVAGAFGSLAVPIGVVAIAGYGAEAVGRIAATALSKPSAEEVASYRQHRAAQVAKKVEEAARRAPPKLKAQARKTSAVVKVAAKRAVAAKGTEKSKEQPAMWNDAFAKGNDSPLGKAIQKQLDDEAKRKVEEEARRKAEEEAKRKAAQAGAAAEAKRKAEQAAAAKAAQKEAARKELVAVLEEKVSFANNKADFVGNADAILTKVAAVLNKYPTLAIKCEGHTACKCSGACKEISRKLSEDRAQACADRLKSKGVKNHVTCVGKGCSDRIGMAVKMFPE